MKDNTRPLYFIIRYSLFNIQYFFSFYSLRSDFTGLARAARMAW